MFKIGLYYLCGNVLKKFVIIGIFASLLVSGCSNPSKQYSLESYSYNYDAVLDSILPFFAKLHDSIPFEKRFSNDYKEYMDTHKKEREYTWLYYTEHTDSFTYFMVYRNEASVKHDKYASICGRFKRTHSGSIDTSSFEELFWTWKMRKPQLLERSAILFKYQMDKGNIEKYKPGKSDGDWVEFPGLGVEYNKSLHTWQ